MSTEANDFVIGDLRGQSVVRRVIDRGFDEVYQLAADMGGAGFVFTGDNDADIMHNSGLINMNVLDESYKRNVKKIFYSSSACMYPKHNQMDPDNPKCSEDSAYPANPDSEYGWEKLYSEIMLTTYAKKYGFEAKIARFQNCYGPEGEWEGGREKAPAAISRKIAEVEDKGEIEIWGDGTAVRSFIYIDDMTEAILQLMQSNFNIPVNIGSPEYVSINELVGITSKIAGKRISVKHIKGPVGVQSRNFSNEKIYSLGWEPKTSLKEGMRLTYNWIEEQVKNKTSL